MVSLVQPPNPRLQRTPSASPPSPLSRQPLGRESSLRASVWVGVLVLFLVARDGFAGQPQIQVVGMSLDPSLLEQSGLTVGDLKAAAVAQLKAAGIDADVQERRDIGTPRLAIAIPVRTSGGEIAAFVLLQYQTAARSEKPPKALLYATTWSRWWGGSAKAQEFASELKRGLKVLVDQFIAEYRKGAL